MSLKDKSNTPAPEVVLIKTFMAQASSERHECSERHNTVHDKLWSALEGYAAAIKAVTSKIDRIYGAIALLAALLILSAPICYYALKGVITEELDKKFPSGNKYHAEAQKKEANAVVVTVPTGPWAVVPSAQANTK
ncbi:hypothetical protein UFOVP276_137 [uncultured Caudovirales phage]|uniref:Uncharacterized protein n=1 Tax=uncultured Caudovirales phage TaxID=2100421 RepID=A0A6J5LLW1_9CAUD|nr:hypothetical protein UFOVP127_31 [uncultured Caudovirales phage]CAB4135181.1 hypothetical protein UFOVP276_137 [uncultured Caudovirales phage]